MLSREERGLNVEIGGGESGTGAYTGAGIGIGAVATAAATAARWRACARIIIEV